MPSSNSVDFYNATFNPLEDHKNSQIIAGLLLTVVIVLHGTLAWYLLNAPQTDTNKPPVIMEVVMMPTPEPTAKSAAQEPPSVQPPVKQEPLKPKPVVKPPKPVKKPVIIKKPAPAPKPQPEAIKEVLPVPDFEPAPPVAAPASATAPSASAAPRAAASLKETTGPERDAGKTVVSGVVPLLRIPPIYPARAASRHLEGWVKVEFTIQTDGSVNDAVVVGSEPEAIFDDAALTAIGKWKFKEKIVNGTAVPQRAVQRLQFKLEQ